MKKNKNTIIWIPVFVVAAVIVAALSWKFLGGSDTGSMVTNPNDRTLPGYGQGTSSGTTSFGNSAANPDSNPATSDLSKELDAIGSVDDTSDLDALGQEVGSL